VEIRISRFGVRFHKPEREEFTSNGRYPCEHLAALPCLVHTIGQPPSEFEGDIACAYWCHSLVFLCLLTTFYQFYKMAQNKDFSDACASYVPFCAFYQTPITGP